MESTPPPVQSQKQQREPKPAKVPVLVRMDQRMHDTLRRIAFERRVSINRLMLDGLAEVLRRHGR
jgi:hypothetical protein